MYYYVPINMNSDNHMQWRIQDFRKGVQVVKARLYAAVGGKWLEAAHLGGSGGMPPQKNFDILDALRWVLEAFSVLGSRTECPRVEFHLPRI